MVEFRQLMIWFLSKPALCMQKNRVRQKDEVGKKLQLRDSLPMDRSLKGVFQTRFTFDLTERKQSYRFPASKSLAMQSGIKRLRA